MYEIKKEEKPKTKTKEIFFFGFFAFKSYQQTNSQPLLNYQFLSFNSYQ